MDPFTALHLCCPHQHSGYWNCSSAIKQTTSARGPVAVFLLIQFIIHTHTHFFLNLSDFIPWISFCPFSRCSYLSRIRSTNKAPEVRTERVFRVVTCCRCWNAITSTIKSAGRSKPIRWVQSERGGGSSCLSTARECRLLRRDNVGSAEEESVLVILLLTMSDVSVEIERTPPSDRGSCFRLISEFLSSDWVLWVSQIRCNVRTWSHCSQLHFKF